MSKYLIVGGVAGGASAAARLRRLDESAEIIMFERGEYISFANCGLPYYIGGDITDKGELTLQTPDSFSKRFKIDVRIKNEVVSIDKENKTVKVKNHQTGQIYTESYAKLILSPGAEPIRPNMEGMDSERVFTLRNIPDTYRIKDYIMEKQPKKAVVVGGGYIGLEMAENLHKLGVEVTIVEGADHVIAALDREMAADVHNYLRKKGIKLIFNKFVTAIKENGKSLILTLDKENIEADMVIMSVGVRPESNIAKEAGLAVNDKGAIITNNHMRTSVENIYAVGDAVEVQEFVSGIKTHIPLAGPANKQGRIAADNICGIASTYKGTQGTGILKVFDMTIAMTGINEQMAKKLGYDYEKSYTFSASHASYYPNATYMSIKLIFDKKNGKIYGGQIVGYEGVDKRIDVLAMAIRAGMTVFDLTSLELAYAPPYSSAKDPINMAGYVAENIITGKVKVFHWHDIDSLPRDKSATLLDIRTETEYAKGALFGFDSITLDELRENLHKLDKTKPVYVTCEVGLRGYIGCRILTQNGFECYNLSGGYRLYRSIAKDSENR